MARHLLILCILPLCGCSTAPLADLMDWVSPGKLEKGPHHGGVASAPAFNAPALPVPAGSPAGGVPGGPPPGAVPVTPPPVPLTMPAPTSPSGSY